MASGILGVRKIMSCGMKDRRDIKKQKRSVMEMDRMKNMDRKMDRMREQKKSMMNVGRMRKPQVKCLSCHI